MSLANSYLRSLIVNLILLGAVALRLLQQIGTKWTDQHTVAAYALGMVCLISTAVVGTISRRNPGRWFLLKVIMASIGCSFATMVLFIIFQKLLLHK